jgi:NAD(P)H-hydrate epimerase
MECVVVTAAEMREIEGRIFEAGMPVAALMEKAATMSASRIQQLYPLSQVKRVGILVGPGHNGGDALVVARELYLRGFQVSIYCPLSKSKELTAQQARYAQSLGMIFSSDVGALSNCELIIDGLFGFGLERSLSDKLAEDVNQLNQWRKPVVSIDIPSGIHTDTGEILGVAVRATHTLCLGLWKRAFFQEQALEYLGQVERIDLGIPAPDVWEVLGKPAPIQKITPAIARKFLPLPRPLTTHKYQQGHLLIICGSRRYAGGAILTGLGARSSGVGMLSIAVPESLKPLLVSHLPEALIIESPESEGGAMAELSSLDVSKYDAIACGPGLTTGATAVVETVLKTSCPLVLDADGLNILASFSPMACLSQRRAPTILTPHLGEFKRLFPHLEAYGDRLQAAQESARQSSSIVLLKGARTVIASPQGRVWLIGESTPALAKGGSGDVLTGFIGGLVAQNQKSRQPLPLEDIVATGAWLHQQAGIFAAKERSELGVDGTTLAEYIFKVITHFTGSSPN